MKTLKEDLKTGNFKHIYLLCGEETYLTLMYKDRLRKALTVPDDEMNTFVSSGKDINVKQIIDLSETMPFFADRRVFFIDNSELFKKCPEEFSSYMAQIPETSYFIFTETGKDKNGKNDVDKRGKLYKQVSKYGHVCEFMRLNEREQKSFLGSLLKKDKRRITNAAASLLLEKTGSDMSLIASETEKLLSYTMGSDTINESDVAAICTGQIQGRIFDMVDAIGNRDQRRALDLYYDLLSLREPTGRILYSLQKHFFTLYRIKEYSGRGLRRGELAAAASVPSYFINKYIAQASKFSYKQLKSAMTDSVKTEEDIKTGIIDDQIALELFIIKYSAAPSQEPI